MRERARFRDQPEPVWDPLRTTNARMIKDVLKAEESGKPRAGLPEPPVCGRSKGLMVACLASCPFLLFRFLNMLGQGSNA